MYGTVAAADTFHTERNSTAWTGTDPEKAAALLRASEWLYGQYAGRYPDMPDPYSGDPVEMRVEYATYLAAAVEAAQPGVLAPGVDTGQKVKLTRVGPLTKEYFQSDDAGTDTPMLASVEAMMRPLLEVPVNPFLVV